MEAKQILLQSKGVAFQVLSRGLKFAKIFRNLRNSQVETDIGSLSETFYLVCQVLSSWNKETLSLVMQSMESTAKSQRWLCPAKLLVCVWLPGPSQGHGPGAGSEPAWASTKGTGHRHAVVPEVMEWVKVLSTPVSRCWFLRGKTNSSWRMQEQEWEFGAWIQGDTKWYKNVKEGREMLVFCKT